MKEISKIQSAYPVVPVKRRDEESTKDDRVLKRKSRKKRPARSVGDGDSPPPLIDEYV